LEKETYKPGGGKRVSQRRLGIEKPKPLSKTGREEGAEKRLTYVCRFTKKIQTIMAKSRRVRGRGPEGPASRKEGSGDSHPKGGKRKFPPSGQSEAIRSKDQGPDERGSHGAAIPGKNNSPMHGTRIRPIGQKKWGKKSGVEHET